MRRVTPPPVRHNTHYYVLFFMIILLLFRHNVMWTVCSIIMLSVLNNYAVTAGRTRVNIFYMRGEILQTRFYTSYYKYS